MAAFPVEVLLGIYLGLMTGILPALVAGLLGFVFRYFTGVTLPGLGVVVLAVAIAGVNGGLMGLVDPTISKSPRLLVAVTVVMMLSLYAHSQGDKLGVALPRRFSLRALRRRTLSADVVEFVGGRGQVTLRPLGPVEDVEGYPPLPADLRAQIAEGRWEFPADLRLSELETRLADRLRTEHDLADVEVSVDDRGRARIAAAGPVGALSRRVPRGQRAVSVEALVPTGMARGESVVVVATRRTDAGGETDDAGDETTGGGGAHETAPVVVEGTLLSARSKGAPAPPPADASDGVADATDGTAPPASAPITAGGEGRVTVAVGRRDADRLLAADGARVVVRSRGTQREYELLGLLRRTGKQVARLPVGGSGPLDGTTIGTANVRDGYDVAVLAVRRTTGSADAGRWVFAPGGDTALAAGDDLFVVGARDALERFREAVA